MAKKTKTEDTMDVPDFLEDGYEQESVTADQSLSSLQGDLLTLAINEMMPNPWNPNTMNDREFQMLVERLKENGMLQPIQVVPHPSESGKYMIIGGEHRWKAAQVLGWDTLPALVMSGAEFQDEDYQKFVTMQLNVISGHLDQEKFLKMYNGLAERHKKEAISDMMGYANKAAFSRLVSDMAQGLPTDEMKEDFKEKAKGVRDGDVNKLGKIVKDLMENHGEDLHHSFMVFDAGGKNIVWIKATEDVFASINDAAALCRAQGLDINDFFMEAITRGIEAYK